MEFKITRHPDRDIKQSFPIRSRVRGWFFRVDELPTVIRPVVQSPGMPEGDETVLLVEDEPAVREPLVLTGKP